MLHVQQKQSEVISALFNNTQTLKFKAQLTVPFFTAANVAIIMIDGSVK